MTVGGAGAPGFEYPLAYTFKVIGLAADDFADHARGVVARATAEPPSAEVSVRASGGGKYLSASVTVVLRSEPERVAVYAALREDPRVVYAL